MVQPAVRQARHESRETSRALSHARTRVLRSFGLGFTRERARYRSGAAEIRTVRRYTPMGVYTFRVCTRAQVPRRTLAATRKTHQRGTPEGERAFFRTGAGTRFRVTASVFFLYRLVDHVSYENPSSRMCDRCVSRRIALHPYLIRPKAAGQILVSKKRRNSALHAFSADFSARSSRSLSDDFYREALPRAPVAPNVRATYYLLIKNVASRRK